MNLKNVCEFKNIFMKLKRCSRILKCLWICQQTKQRRQIAQQDYRLDQSQLVLAQDWIKSHVILELARKTLHCGIFGTWGRSDPSRNNRKSAFQDEAGPQEKIVFSSFIEF
jgi:hypothetical protein